MLDVSLYGGSGIMGNKSLSIIVDGNHITGYAMEYYSISMITMITKDDHHDPICDHYDHC